MFMTVTAFMGIKPSSLVTEIDGVIERGLGAKPADSRDSFRRSRVPCLKKPRPRWIDRGFPLILGWIV